MPRYLLTALAAALALAACDDVREVTTALTAPSLLPIELLDTPHGAQLAWALDIINERGGDVSEEEIAAHFTPKYLEWLPAPKIRAAFESIAHDFAPLSFDRVRPERDGRLAVLGDSAVGPTRLLLGVDDDTGQISSFLTQPYLDLDFPGLLAHVPTLAPRAQLLVAEVDHGACVPLHAVNADDVQPIASTSKLYILLALVDAIDAGELDWDTPLAIRDDRKSKPESALSRWQSGQTMTLRGFAENLIDHSDNTANDHLVHALGRERVEAAVRDSGHHDPARNTPYITSREFFHQRRLGSDELDRYAALSDRERRSYLDDVLLTRPQLPSWARRPNLDRVGIYASATDLCHLLATLVERIETEPAAAPLLDILPKGLSVQYSNVSRKIFPFIGGKGGSLPGVLNKTWLLRRDDDRWFAVISGFVDDGEFPRAVADADLRAVTWRIFDLLADEDR